MVIGLIAYVGGIALVRDDGLLANLINTWLSNALLVAATLSCLARGVVVARERLAWLVLGAGMLSWTLGDIYWALALSGLSDPPFPSVSDALYLGFYPAGYIALMLLVRARITRFHTSLWLDGLVAGLAIASVGAALVLAPVLAAADGRLAAVVTDLVYPLADILLLGLVGGVMALTAWRPGTAWCLLGLGFASLALADAVYLQRAAVGSYAEGTVLDAGWAVGIVLMGIAALQPRHAERALDLAGRRMLVVPGVFALLALGVVVYSHFFERATPALALAVMTVLAVMIRMAFTFSENARLAASLADARADAATDPLTGLLTHRGFHERSRAEIARARRHGREVSLVVFDLDHFALVNGEHGLQEGDGALAEVARRLQEVTRIGDVLGRVGGQEFALLLPETDGPEAWRMAERARAAIGAPISGVGRLTISAGVCSLAQAGSATELYRLAAGALYWAKGHGRDMSIHYSPQVVQVLSDEERAVRLERSQALNAIRVLARAVDAKDQSTQRHSERVADVAVMLATASGWSIERLATLREAALVHDVGKIGIPDAVLLKPGRLTASERTQIEAHAVLGAQMVADVLTAEQVAWVRHHHERHDGAGYPDGIAGDAIPEGARLLAVADCWDAMTVNRPYRSALSPSQAMAGFRRCAGSQWSVEAVGALERLWVAEAIGHDAPGVDDSPGDDVTPTPSGDRAPTAAPMSV